jgi:hypothetical protein
MDQQRHFLILAVVACCRIFKTYNTPGAYVIALCPIFVVRPVISQMIHGSSMAFELIFQLLHPILKIFNDSELR